MIWNPKTCSCECIYQNQHCNNELEWIPSLCRFDNNMYKYTFNNILHIFISIYYLYRCAKVL